MANEKNETEYFERGLGLVLSQIEFLIDRVGKIDYKFVEELSVREQQLEVVEDDDEFQKNAAAFSELRQDMIEDSLYEENREIFLLLTEVDRLNNHLLILLTDDDGNHSLVEVQKYVQEQFNIKIREILAMNDVANVLDQQALEILKILVNEKKFADLEEGLNLVLSLTPLNEATKSIYEVLSEAHILMIYHDLLGLKEEKPTKAAAKPKAKSKAKPKTKKKK